METIQKPGAQTAIDELRNDALSAEDLAYLDAEQDKLNAERTELGLSTTAAEVGQLAVPELVAGPGGVAVPRAEVQEVIENGQELFEDGNRRA